MGVITTSGTRRYQGLTTPATFPCSASFMTLMRWGPRFDVGPHEFKIWTRHKWRGSSIYNATHGQERGARFDDPNFDVYVGAHVHKGAMAREFIHDAGRRLAMLTGTYKAVDDYASSEGFPRNDASTAVAPTCMTTGRFTE